MVGVIFLGWGWSSRHGPGVTCGLFWHSRPCPQEGLGAGSSALRLSPCHGARGLVPKFRGTPQIIIFCQSDKSRYNFDSFTQEGHCGCVGCCHVSV